MSKQSSSPVEQGQLTKEVRLRYQTVGKKQLRTRASIEVNKKRTT